MQSTVDFFILKKSKQLSTKLHPHTHEFEVMSFLFVTFKIKKRGKKKWRKKTKIKFLELNRRFASFSLQTIFFLFLTISTNEFNENFKFRYFVSAFSAPVCFD